MKITGFVGSPRKGGNTDVLVRQALSGAEEGGAATRLVYLNDVAFRDCQGCGFCKRAGACRLNDGMEELYEAIRESDGIIVGSPVYFADITPETKALIDRAGYATRVKPETLRRKVGAGVVVNRRAGAVHALDSINHLFGVTEMITVGSTYWNLAVGGRVGTVTDDTEGMATMERLGENMAWLLKTIERGAGPAGETV